VSRWPPKRPNMYLFWPWNIDWLWNCPLKPPVVNSFSAFISGTSAPYLGQNKYICGLF
jgi:hypothetical protein